MVDPFGLAGELVKGLVESVKGARTNREECALLVNRGKQTLVLLNQIKSKMIVDQTLSKAIDYVNEDLKKAQDAINNCCNTGCLCSMIRHRSHSLQLHQVEKELSYALFQIPLAALGINLDIQDDLATLVDRKSHEKFEERAARTQQTNTLKKEIEQVYYRMNEGFEKILARGNQGIGEASAQTSQLGKKASTTTNEDIENIKNQIRQIQKLGFQLEKRRALMGTKILVQDIVDISANVKINEDGCALLARLAQQTLSLLDNFDISALSNTLVMAALCHLNEALAIVKHSMNDCSHTNAFHDAKFGGRCSSMLKKGKTMLKDALAEILPLLDGMSQSMQSTLSSLCDKLHDLKFDGSVDVESDDILLEKPSDFVGSSHQMQDSNGQSLLNTSTPKDSNEDSTDVDSSVTVHDKSFTPLHIASKNNQVEVIKELIANGADIDSRDDDGASPLYVASQNGHLDVVKELIAKSANIDLQKNDEASPLYTASFNNHLGVVKELIANGAEVDLPNKNGASPLYVASQNDHLDVVKELIAKSANVDLQKNDGASPLYTASFSNHLDVVKELIANGADINLQDNDGASPLFVASQNGHLHVELIAKSANVNLQINDGASPLYVASQNGHLDVVKELIAKSANVDLQMNDGTSPLYLASQNGHLNVVKELIANVAEVNLRTKKGDVPLHIAASCGRVHIVQVLLEHGASKDARNNWLRKPYHVVCTNQSYGPYENTTIEELKSLLRR